MALLSSILGVVGPAVKAVTSFLPIPSVARTAISMGMDAVAGGKLPSVTGLISSLAGGDAPKLFASMKGIPGLVDAQKGAAAVLLQGQQVIADSIRAQRDARLDGIASAAAARWGNDVSWSDDIVFSTLSRITVQNRVTVFGVLLPRASFGAATSTPLSGAITTCYGTTFDFSAGTNGFGAVYAISQWIQDRTRAYFNTRSLFEITPVLTVIQKLWLLAKDLDNPYDFFNFFGYKGPEVVAPLAGLDLPIINAALDRISKHRTTKSLDQWFAAASYFKDALTPYRKITADWLGTEAGDLPTFLIDMLSFYLLTNWGSEMVAWLYDQDASIEMVKALPVATFNAMHSYDKYDALHFMLNGADTGYELVYGVTPIPPAAITDLQKNTWRLAAYHLLTITNLTMLMRNIITFNNFGVDSEDISDLYDSLTGAGTTDPSDYWEPIASLCDADNADFIRIGVSALTEAIAEATIAEAELVILDSDDLVSAAKLEGMVRNIEQAMASRETMTDVEILNLVRICDSAATNLQHVIDNNMVDEPTRAKNLLIRIKAATAMLNATSLGRR